jgi:hypothetical protein
MRDPKSCNVHCKVINKYAVLENHVKDIKAQTEQKHILQMFLIIPKLLTPLHCYMYLAAEGNVHGCTEDCT